MNTDVIRQSVLLMRLHKPIGILLLLWPTLWALWLAADGKPDYHIVILFILGVVIMRSAGCIINDIADRHVDGFVKRTQKRPLAANTMTSKTAFILFMILLICAFCIVLSFNAFTIKLAFIGSALAMIYPFLKRITHLPQVGLGFAFSWGIPMAFAAIQNTISWQAWVLFFTAILWPIIYDTMYAMTDRFDDIKVGIKSSAILFGEWDCLIIGFLQIGFIILLISVGYLFQLNWMYDASLFLVAGLFIYQQKLIRKRIPERCFQAFLNNHWVGLSIFLGIVLSYENCCR